MQGGGPIAVRARIDVRVIYLIGTADSQSDDSAVRDSEVFSAPVAQWCHHRAQGDVCYRVPAIKTGELLWYKK